VLLILMLWHALGHAALQSCCQAHLAPFATICDCLLVHPYLQSPHQLLLLLPPCRGPTTTSYLLKALNKATAATLPAHTAAAATAANTAADTAANTQHLDPGPSSSSGDPPSRAAAAAIAATAARSELQAQIEAVLPPRGNFKERYGAAGTTIDQRRESPIVEMSLLLSEAVMHGLRTIAFCKSRKLCELVAAYCRENLRAAAPHKAQLVKVCGQVGLGGGVGGGLRC
jgi:hypothetical protein